MLPYPPTERSRVSFFEGNIVQVSSVTSSAGVIWNPTNSGSTFGPLGTIPSTTAVIGPIGIANLGPQTIYVGGATVTVATGLPVPPGGQVGIRRYSYTPGVASSNSGTISAITATGTSIVQAGLVTQATVY